MKKRPMPHGAAAAAQAFLDKRKRIKRVDPWDLIQRFGLRRETAERILNTEMLKRGDITLADLTPCQRRALVDPEKLDLHAIAAGPIMDSNELYLPAGKISLAEALAREAAAIIAFPAPTDRGQSAGAEG